MNTRIRRGAAKGWRTLSGPRGHSNELRKRIIARAAGADRSGASNGVNDTVAHRFEK